MKDITSTHEHIFPISMYVRNLIILMILMAATILVAIFPFEGNSYLNNAIALGIAVAKATLVIMYFMHAKFSSAIAKFFAILGFLFLILMFGILIDYKTRYFETTPSWEKHSGNSITREQRGMSDLKLKK